MEKTDLTVVVLRDGTQLVRPADAIGTCGPSPKPWVMTRVKRHNPLSSFLNANPNWTYDEVGCISERDG